LLSFFALEHKKWILDIWLIVTSYIEGLLASNRFIMCIIVRLCFRVVNSMIFQF